MSLRERVAVAAAQSSTAIHLDRTQLRRGVRWEASHNGRTLGVCTVYTDGLEEGWTVDGSSQERFRDWIETAYQIAHGHG